MLLIADADFGWSQVVSAAAGGAVPLLIAVGQYVRKQVTYLYREQAKIKQRLAILEARAGVECRTDLKPSTISKHDIDEVEPDEP
jgi:hypothetical protein